MRVCEIVDTKLSIFTRRPLDGTVLADYAKGAKDFNAQFDDMPMTLFYTRAHPSP